jgi:uncharacterized membrane protein YdjX (TVP38/TMEM64 family)
MKENKKNIIKSILILCISLLFIYLLIRYQKHFARINVKGLRNYILSFGPFASLVFVLLYSLKPVVFVFPALLLTILAGNIFGPIKGFILVMIGLTLSGTFAFYLARSLGKPFVTKITRGKLLKLDENIENHGFKIMLLMRLSTLFPYDPLSYAAGLTKMKYRDFILASVIGAFPEMLAYCYLGHNMRYPSSRRFIIPVVLVAAVAIGGSFMYRSAIKKKNHNNT